MDTVSDAMMSAVSEDTLDAIASDFDYTVREDAAPEAPSDLLRVAREKLFSLLYMVGDSGSGKTCALQSLLAEGKYHALSPVVCTGEPLASLFTSIGVNDKNSVITVNDKNSVIAVNDKNSIIARLTMSGLSSVPVWFRPYGKASKGEQFRADIALGLKSFCFIDEFTSNLDRLTARSLSYSLRKYCERYSLKNIILAGCQYDVIPWLQPDHVYDLNERCFLPLTAALQRWRACFSSVTSLNVDSKVLTIRPSSKDRWKLYSQHHYLSNILLDNASFWEAFITVDTVERAVAFAAVCPMPSGTVERAIRGHRLVVIPSAQGMGIGAVMSEAVAQHYLDEGYRYFSKTSHPRLGEYRDRSARWMPTGVNRKIVEKNNTVSRWDHTQRKCYSHEYCGEAGREGMFARRSDNTSCADELEILPPLPVFAFLRPLKVYGVISVSNAGNVIARVDHKETVFPAKEYRTLQDARTAAEIFLEEHSAKSCATNLYSVDDGAASVDLSPGNKGVDFLRVDARHLPLLSDCVWRRRGSRVFSSGKEGRVYIETVLYPGRKITAYLNGDKADYRESNLVFSGEVK